MHKILHLDLKGAPMKIPFLEQVLKAAYKWGCTGVLIEWEDTFPYTGDIAEIGSNGTSNGDNMYTREEVKHIIKCTYDLGFDAIQLIQTIGHMEFVLKHPKFKHLREERKTPSVLCPSRPESLVLVKDMVRQALDVQPDARYIHIGADEVWHIAACDECKKRAIMSEYGVASLFLEHICEIVAFVKKHAPVRVIVLMWDDMLRSINVEALKHYKIGDLVQPIIWNYNVKEHFKFPLQMWLSYEQVFTFVWAGSAFKGANGSSKMVSPIERYASNQEAWMHLVKNNKHKVSFFGMIFTGWSRYDHYATMCELMPVAFPSLATCMNYWTEIYMKNDDIVIIDDLTDWPGRDLAEYIMQTLVALRDQSNNLIHGDMVATWLNPWQVEHSFTSPAQVECIKATSEALLSNYKEVEGPLMGLLTTITGKRSATEWMYTNVTAIVNKIEDIHNIAIQRISAGASIKPR
ncbi:hexosaminidase D-like [Vanessa cardui]|uniref:hexosaminidase D-like n=1 Tax=Vanessa cardui TaxID=171605 RepID=UPI001F129D77|nr:hexosaminidase D-like [Vanessa cardui]